MSVELSTIYKQIAAGKGKEYELLFSIVGLFSSVMEFDPVTDDPLPVTVDDVLYGLSSVNAEKCDWQNDRLQHVVCFVSTAVRNLIDLLHEKGKSLRVLVCSRRYPVRLAFYLLLAFTIVIFGAYGDRFISSNFIYIGF